MLAYKPDTATVTPKTAVKNGREVTGFASGSTFSIQGMLSQKEPGTVFAEWGLELKFPAIWMCDIADGALIEVGDKIVVGGVTYFVKAGPKVKNAEPTTSYAKFAIARDA